MGKIPTELRAAIAQNIRTCNAALYPGRGGRQKAAEDFGVSPQQWSPWCRGLRTPDELRLQQIGDFFAVTVEWLRRDNAACLPTMLDVLPGADYSNKRDKWHEILEREREQPRFPRPPSPETPPTVSTAQGGKPPTPINVLPSLHPESPTVEPYGIHIVASGTLVQQRYESELSFNNGMTIPGPAIADINNLRDALRSLGHNLLRNGYTLRFEVLVAFPQK